MHIKFVNFKCYVDNEFDIPDKGLVLLAGDSGKGKSTLLKGIIFALFGKKSGIVTKPFAFNTSTCNVTLQWCGVNIYRSCRPNRLLVNDKLEDEHGQAYINNMLNISNYKEFLYTSYIMQKASSSILSVPPTEQLNIIKLYAFDNELVERHKNYIKEMTKTVYDNLIKLRGEYNFIKKEYDAYVSNNVCNNDEDIINEIGNIKEFNNMVDECVLLLNELHTKHKTYTESYNTALVTTEKITILTENINEYNSEKEKWKILLHDIPDDIQNQINIYNKKINFIEKQVAYKTYLKQYTEMHDNEISERKKRMELLSADVWSGLSYKDAQKQLMDVKTLTSIRKKFNIPNDTNSLDYLNNMNKKLIKKEENIRAMNVLECPKCLTRVYYNTSTNKLVSVTIPSVKCTESLETIIIEKEACQQALNTLVDIVMTTTSAKELQEYIQNNLLIESELKSLASNKYSATLLKVKNNLERLRQELAACGDDGGDGDGDITELKTQVTKLGIQATRKKEYITEYNKYVSKYKKAKMELTNLKNIKMGNIEILKKNLNIIDKKIVATKEKHEKLVKLIPRVKKYQEYLKLQDTINEWKSKMDKCNTHISTSEKEYASLLVLKSKYNQAEVVALESVINSINEYTWCYLDKFFLKNKIKVKLCISICPSKKIAITTNITNDIGNVYDNIHEISGGELDRCNLANICGVNDMIGSNLLMLDESLSSVDNKLNLEILMILKNIAKTKLVIVCSHEAVTGVFDNVIML